MVVSQLKASDLENFLDEKLAGGLAPQTVNHLRGYVSRAFTTARRKGWWTGVNPVTDVHRKPVPKGVVGDYLPVEEVPVVLEQLARRWRPLFAAALYTGLRKGELRALRKEDVDLERGPILVRRSGGRATTKGDTETPSPSTRSSCRPSGTPSTARRARSSSLDPTERCSPRTRTWWRCCAERWPGLAW